MPLITTRTSKSIDKEREISLKTEYGKAMSLIGKSESWLMCDFIDNSRLYFKGSDEESAIVEVELFGKASDEGYDALTKKLTDTVSSVLGINSDRIYVKYTEIGHWGYNGFNF